MTGLSFLSFFRVLLKIVTVFLFVGCATAPVPDASSERQSIETNVASATTSQPTPKDLKDEMVREKKIVPSPSSPLHSELQPESESAQKTDTDIDTDTVHALEATPKSETQLEEKSSDTNEIIWETDLEQAKQKAAEANKNIFMLVTAISWCLPCQLLHEHVFEKTPFLNVMSQKYIFFVVDFSEAPDDEAAQKRVEALVAEYEVTTLPEMLLLDKDGGVFGRFEFEGTDAESYHNIVNRFEQSRDKLP